MHNYILVSVMSGMQDLPDDPTGQLDKVEQFVKDNINICKWVALGVVIVEVIFV